MFLRAHDGFYAGEIREFPPHIGIELVRQGRASNPFLHVEDAPEERAIERAKTESAAPTNKGKNRR